MLVAATPPRARRGPLLALARFLVVVAVLVFAPVVGVFHAWSAVAAVSARSVFAAELTAYGQNLVLPHLWHDVPLGVRAVVVLALLVAALAHRWPHPFRAVVLTLAIAITASQAGGVLRWLDVWPWLLNRLPRPFYIEFYLPVFYAVPAAYTLHRWAQRRDHPAAVTVLAGLVGVVVGVWGVLGTIAAFLGWRARSARPVRGQGLVPVIGVLGVLGSALLTWELAPQTMHPVFAAHVHCRARGLWCADAPGPSLGAGASPITEFLRERLDGDRFLGRAEFLLTPPARLAAFSLVEGDAAAATADVVLRWYERAHRHVWGVAAPPVAPATAVARLRELMWSSELPEDVVLGIYEWAASHPQYLKDVRLGSGWGHDAEITIMVQERNRNFAATGNGMLLRALPLQGVPVASSYEQSLDHLYYLFWTRYVNAGATLRHSINFTTLYRLWPERLALIGVKYLVARDVPLRPSLDLPTVFRWHGYSVHEIARANTAGWGVTRVVAAPTLTEELRRMREPGFDPRHTAAVAATETDLLGPREWAPLAESRVQLDGQSMVFTARSAGQRTLAVLPFKFSHCWREEWRGRPGRVVRVDTALIGVAFEAEADLRLTWTAGYGPLAQCLTRDAELTPQAKAAAAELE